MDIGSILLALSVVGQQVAENLFGTFVRGPAMRLVAIGSTVGLAIGAWHLGLEALAPYTLGKVVVLGVAAGLGSNVVHALLGRFAPGANDATLGTLVKNAMAPLPPTIPKPPSVP